MDNNLLWERLAAHRGHSVSIVSYGDKDSPSDVCLECEDCNEVILDAELYTICAKEEDRYAVVRWSVEDVIAAAEEQDVTLTEEQAARWWEKNESSFSEMLVADGNERLSYMNFEEEDSDGER